MESQDAKKVIITTSDAEIVTRHLSCKESLTGAELSDSIEAAVCTFEEVQKQLARIRSMQHNKLDQNDSVHSQESSSSYSSFKKTCSDQSVKNDFLNTNHFCHKKTDEVRISKADQTENNENQVQIVMTPRSQRKESYLDVPNIEIRVGDSLVSIKTNKRSRKIKKRKSQSSKLNEEQVKTSLIYSSKNKRKKFHGRLKNSNSKSTIATRDTIYSDKKMPIKKFKRQKSLDRISKFEAPQFRKRTGPLKAHESKQITPKEFIEIYHKNNLKNRKSPVVISRQTKAAPTHLTHVHEQETQAANVDRKKKHPPIIVEQKGEISSNAETQQVSVELAEEINKNTEQSQVQEHGMNECQQNYYDPFAQKNYELPTKSSENKRVRRPYYHNYSIRSIPFVAGTSLSPSHNLGLNIQQVLGIIKAKQPAVPGVSPLLIRKVSRGIRPVTTLFEHINTQYARSCRNLTEEQRSNLDFHRKISSFSCDHLRNNNVANQSSFKQNFTCEPLYEEDEDSHSTYSESRAKSQIIHEKATPFEVRLGSEETNDKSRQFNGSRQRQTRKHEQQVAVSDSMTGNAIGYPNNNVEMTEVFTRIYDEFDKMISQHDKLKEQFEKRKDKALAKEISELEVAIRAKEQEIAAVVNLYKEVMSLKHQMKLLYERNSFVCISTADPAFHQASRTASKARARTAGYFECRSKPKFHYSHRNNGVHDTPNALKLVGLLRQVQAFHRQLTLA